MNWWLWEVIRVGILHISSSTSLTLLQLGFLRALSKNLFWENLHINCQFLNFLLKNILPATKAVSPILLQIDAQILIEWKLTRDGCYCGWRKDTEGRVVKERLAGNRDYQGEGVLVAAISTLSSCTQPDQGLRYSHQRTASCCHEDWPIDPFGSHCLNAELLKSSKASKVSSLKPVDLWALLTENRRAGE